MSTRTERRLAAIMFTDVVGYTSFTEANEAQALVALEEHRTLMRSIFPNFNGKEVKTIGDAFLVEFSSALEAVNCSVEIQKRLREKNKRLSESKRLVIRIGVHLGDVVKSQGDILGDAVNVSSRIEPLAEPGGVCISGQVYDQVRNKLTLSLEKLEPKTLKNVRFPIDVYRIVMPWEAEAREGTAINLDRRRIAVLPLRNMSPDPNDEYFADGMTEELITSLSAIKEFTVIARTSVMQYKGTTKRIDEIGRDLKAGTLIEGSVRKAGSRIRITVQLIDARNEGHIWAQNYDKQLDDVFAIQSEVAQKVADALKIQLGESDVRKIERGATRNPEAYNLYLKGMFFWNKRSAEAIRKAIDFLEDAVKLDLKFALGYAGIAQCYNVIAANHLDEPEPSYRKAKEYSLRALSLDDELAEAHAVLAGVYGTLDRDPQKSEAQFRRAIELNPNYATAHQWYSQLLSWMGRIEESEREITKALELNPLSLIINTNYGDHLYYKRKFDLAIAQFRKTIDMDPSFAPAYHSLLQAYITTSRFPEALEILDAVARLGSPAEVKLGRAYAYSAMKRKEETHELLTEIQHQGVEQKELSPYIIALIHFQLGEKDEGFEWLERAFKDYDRTINNITVDYELDGLRSDPRYISLLERLGLARYFQDRES
ncbi:MAG TPA: adenylate/guanylate cyclase domain-containing protein [Nitrososphaerales archaeon]|nr:adenylate/guanylate cyclase domain-containing protein [Nitrososphaerales archaeon]